MDQGLAYVQRHLSNDLNRDLVSRVDRYEGFEATPAGMRISLSETDHVNRARHTFGNSLYTKYAAEEEEEAERRTRAFLTVEIIDDGILHVRFLRNGAAADHPIVSTRTRARLEGAAADSDGIVAVRGGGLVVSYDTQLLRLSILDDKTGRVVLAETNGERSLYHGWYAPPLGSVQIDDTKYTCQSFQSGHDEEYFGLGERYTRLGRRGMEFEIWNRDPAHTMGTRSYLTVPFYLSTAGYGLLSALPGKALFDMGTRTSAAVTLKTAGDCLDYFVLVDPDPKGILRKYFALTGAPRPTPRWSYGLWMSYPTDFVDSGTVIEKAQDIRERALPTDVLYIDPPWMGVDSLVCTLEWGPKFAGHAEMIRRLHDTGYKLCLWICPYVPREGRLYEEGIAAGYFVRDTAGRLIVNQGPMNFWSREFVYVDFTNPSAAQWYRERLKGLLVQGVDILKVDLGELGPEEALYTNGMCGVEGHNFFTLEFSRVVFEATQEVKGDDAMIWCRSGTTGSHRYPVHWAGDVRCDFPNMAGQLRAVLGAGMSGLVFFSHDIGGFSGKKTPDLYARWFQFGMFTSHARCHSGSSPNYPWHYGDRVERICRRYLEIRYSLSVHLFSAGVECCRRGVPMMRSMYLEYPDDPAARLLETQYIFCDEFLVAPVFEPEGTRDVYLPRATWYDFWSGEKLEGPCWIRRQCPLETMPVFVKAGSMLLRTRPKQSLSRDTGLEPLTLEIYPGGSMEKTLWLDFDRSARLRCELSGGKAFVDCWGISDGMQLSASAIKGSGIVDAEVRRHVP